MRKSKAKVKLRHILCTAAYAVIFAVIVTVTVLMSTDLTDFGLKTGKLASLYSNPPSDGEIRLHFIDVGQADSTLISSPYGNILIDTGSNDSESALRAHLSACGIDKLDYLICTHPHSDHIGGADMLIEDLEIGKLIMSDSKSDEACYEQLLDAMEKKGITAELVTPGTKYALGDISFLFLAPLTHSDDLNNMSLAVKFTFGETDFLFTGDLEADSELKLLDAYGTETLDCELLKVGHHGSASASDGKFLEAVSPEVAVISCGKDNSYGHPRGEVIEALESIGTKTLLRTDISGTAVVKSDGKSITVLIGENTFSHMDAKN